MNVLLAWHNQIELATLTSTAAYAATLPLTNLQNYLLPKVARTTSSAAFTITATAAALATVGCVFIANHNLGRLSTVRIKSYTGATLMDDSGVMAVYPQRSGTVVSAARTVLSSWTRKKT